MCCAARLSQGLSAEFYCGTETRTGLLRSKESSARAGHLQTKTTMVAVVAVLYSLILAGVIAVAAAAVERVFATRRWARRGIWIVSLATSVLLPVVLIYGERSLLCCDDASFRRPWILCTRRARGCPVTHTAARNELTPTSAR
jgi:hypothetical protein